MGVEIEDAWKCQSCEYADICEWRRRKAGECFPQTKPLVVKKRTSVDSSENSLQSVVVAKKKMKDDIGKDSSPDENT